MISKAFEIPILFLIFNRPDCTQKVFEKIQSIRPKRLFVAADGPRSDKPEDLEKCILTRGRIHVDWDCEVKTLFRDTNLGCKKAVSGAIDWFFENVEEGIILEDDCLPDPTFFLYCEELLLKYRHDDRVALVSGHNVQFGGNPIKDSYYFSKYPLIWGWASWRRAWQYYDVNITHWPNIREERRLHDILRDKHKIKYWTGIFNKVYKGEIDTWDYQWILAYWLQGAWGIVPNVNLVSNIGFGRQDATHTPDEHRVANIPIEQMTFPIQHPTDIKPNRKADNFTELILFSRKPLSIWIRIKNKLKMVIN